MPAKKPVNDEFDLGDVEVPDAVDVVAAAKKAKAAKAKATRAANKAKKEAAEAKAQAELVEAERKFEEAKLAAELEKFVDPELDRENWPTIHIEMEEGKPNYEYLAAHGTMQNGASFGHELQVMRGVDVQVPPSIVNMLRTAVATHVTQVRNASTGKLDVVRQERSSIPWRLMNGGKYC